MENTINIDLGIHNKFEVEVVDSITGKVKQKAVGYNVLTNNFFSAGYMYATQILFGDGSGTPSSSDYTLFNYVGYVGTNVYARNYDRQNGVFSITRKGVVGTSVAVGKNITEVGLGIYHSSNRTEASSHAMLQDQNGNPISIPKTDTDIINFYATVYVHYTTKPNGLYNFGDIQFVPDFLANDRKNFVERSGYPGQYWYIVLYNKQKIQNWWSIADVPDYNATYAKQEMGFSYNSSLHKWTWSTRLEASTGNGTYGVRNLFIGPWSESSGNIPLTSYFIGRAGEGAEWFDYSTIENESVGTGDGVTKDFKLDFMYPKNVVVKVDGIVNNNISVDYAPPTTDLSDYIDFIVPSAKLNNLIPRRRSDSTTQVIMRNPAYIVGLASFTAEAGDIEVGEADILTNEINWTKIATQSSSGTFIVPEEYKNYKYFRFYLGATSDYTVTADADYTGYNLHFDDPPAKNSIITASYKADCIAKNSDKVFDIKIEMTLTEFSQ